MEITFYGTRGSIPAPSSEGFDFYTAKYGGESTCVKIQSDEHVHIIDAGSGIRRLGNHLLGKGFTGNGEATIYFTHFHWDHIQGFPFFKPAFIKGNKLTLIGEKKGRDSLEETLEKQQQYPNFPVTLEQMRDMGSNLEFIDVVEGEQYGNGIKIGYTKMNHPDGVFCYRFEENGRRFVFASDTEHDGILQPDGTYEPGLYDRRLIEWARDAEVLVYDAQYTEEEYDPEKFGQQGMSKKTWGHSTYEKGVYVATAAGAKKVVLTHHDPEHDDRFLDQLAKRATEYARQKNPKLEVIMARDGLKLNI